MAAAESNRIPPMPSPGTSLVDRINVAIHLRRYLKLIGQRWFVIALCALAGVGHSGYKAFTTPDKYRAWSTLGIAPKLDTTKPEVREELNNFYPNQISIMQGQKVLGRVRERLRDYKSPSGQTPWANPHAERGQGSSFVMTVESTDFNYAKKFADFWADEFIAYKTEFRGGAVSEEAKTTAQSIEKYQKDLDNVRNQITKFRREHDIASAKDTGDAAQQRLDEITARYYKTKEERELYEGMSREQLAEGALGKGLMPKSPRATPNKKTTDNGTVVDSASLDQFSDPKYLDLESQLKNKQNELQRQSAILKPDHPYWIQLTGETANLQQQIEIQLAQIDAKRKAMVEALIRQEKSLKDMIEDHKQEVFRARTVQQEFSQLQEQETRIKGVLDSLQQEKVRIDLANASEDTITIIDKGQGAAVPYEPQRTRMVLQGLLLGLVVGLGIVYFLHRLDDRLDLAEDIEAELEEPVLGQIPQMNNAAMRDGHLLITKLEHHNMFSESIRGVRSAIKFGAHDGAKQIILVSSAVPGDGKTTFTVNFAVTLASAGNRVLLIDADLRRGNTHTFFGHPREPGLSEVLMGEQHWSDVVRSTTEVKTLRVLHTGQIPTNPGELLIGPVTGQLVAEVKGEFDYIIFDCPPLTSLDDTFSLIGLAEGLIFVVKSGQTSMRFAKNALAAVRQRGLPILGVVLNGITADNPYYYYSNYYHAYYSKEQPAPKAGAPGTTPAKRMASPRAQRDTMTSIEAQAKLRVGESASQQKIANEEEAKLQMFKARRAAKATDGDQPATSPASIEPTREESVSGAASVREMPSPHAQHEAATAIESPLPDSSVPEKPTAPTGGVTLDVELKQLKQLLADGLITQQDFDTRKQKKIAEAAAKLRLAKAQSQVAHPPGDDPVRPPGSPENLK